MSPAAATSCAPASATLPGLNRWFLALSPAARLARIHSSSPPIAQPIHILDVGCGYGDGLRRIERWAHARGIAVELTGLDINPDAVAIAAEATLPSSRIRWVAADVFAYRARKPVHLVVSSLFTHHLSEADIVRFLQWMEQHAALGWFINDLSRAAIPYHLFRVFSNWRASILSCSMTAPSPSRAPLCRRTGGECAPPQAWTASAIAIQAFKPARFCVARRKTQ